MFVKERQFSNFIEASRTKSDVLNRLNISLPEQLVFDWSGSEQQ